MSRRQSGEPQISTDLKHSVHIAFAFIALGIVVTILAGWYAVGHAVSTIDAAKLGQQISALESLAAESHILASQYAMGRSPDNFTKASAVQLHQSVSGIADTLAESNVDASVEKQTKQVEEQASDLADALSELARLPDAKTATNLDQQIVGVQQEVGEIL